MLEMPLYGTSIFMDIDMNTAELYQELSGSEDKLKLEVNVLWRDKRYFLKTKQLIEKEL